jgi:transcriptional regulator with XRE-family HTH domain
VPGGTRYGRSGRAGRAPGGAAAETLAEKLERLFRTVRPAGRREYSLEEAALAIRRGGGPTISASYLWLLRTGRKANPTKRHLEALASFFGVSPAYFFDDALGARSAADLDLLATLRAAPLRRIAVAAAELSPAGQRAVAILVEHIRDVERGTGSPPPRRIPRAPRRGRRPRSGPAPPDAPTTPSPSPSPPHQAPTD